MILDCLESDLFRRLAAIVVKRGLRIGAVGRYLYVTVWDNGARWDTGTQGAIPTLAEINAVTLVEVEAAEQNSRVTRRDKTLWTPQILSLTRETHDRFRAANVDNMTMGTFRAGIEAEYDAIVNV